MTHPFNASSVGPCAGPESRRGFLRMGLAGFATLSLPGILRCSCAAQRQRKSAEKTAVIMVWKPGGCSHIDTYDPKPEAPASIAGPSARSRPRFPGCGSPNCFRGRPRSPTSSRSCGRCGTSAAGHPAGIDADALRRSRYPRQTRTHAARLDVGGKLSAVPGRTSHQSAARLRRRQSADALTTVRRISATPTRPFSVTGDPN